MRMFLYLQTHTRCKCNIYSNYRAARGKHLSLVIRFASPGRNVDDIDIFTHSNDTLASLRRQILRRIKASGTNVKLDLFINGDSLEQSDDRKLLSQIPLRDKMVNINKKGEGAIKKFNI